ncbi:MAG TPA: DNA translocase FtsK 4TM domain-containing protein [Gemmatimonadota bacterium]|nr:DNA translocase FtsK 4TM domain-containing protein [Gemmatimonadota bacterium]
MPRKKKKDSTRLKREILGILMAATGGFVLVALWPWDPGVDRGPETLNRVGILGAYSAFYLYRALGFGALALGAGLAAFGILLLFDRVTRKALTLGLGALAAVWLLLSVFGVTAAWIAGPSPWGTRAGAAGMATASGLIQGVGLAGALIFCVVAAIVLAAATFRISLAATVEAGVEAGRAGGRHARERFDRIGGRLSGWSEERRARGGEEEDEPEEPVGEPAPVTVAVPAPAAPGHQAPRSRPARGSTPRRSRPESEGGAGWLPPLSLLEAQADTDTGQTTDDLDRLGRVLIEKLRSFNVEGEIAAIHSGPVLTQFEVSPAPGVKVNQIANLADDLALAMRAQRIRIVAPIPGKGAVGIEIPNPRPRVVRMREMLESPLWSGFGGKVPLALGHEIAGAPIVADLTRMPHLLIAGATGSGKSVCINAIVTSLLYRYGPDAVRFIMIDPKMLELVVYNGIPHLLHPVVVEHKESAKALKWTVSEMERRYRLLAANGIRSLADYNARVKAGDLVDPAGGDDDRRPLPYIVVLIDELADLMLTVQQEIEEPLARLAQMARAVGIHLVLATQRPSVNVITGVIKANFPSRISFQVSSKIDSRTVLDMNGAEQLLGNGDMLFLPADRAEPVRIQGAFISSEETGRVVDWLREAGRRLNAEEIAPPVDIIAEASELEIAALDERDELFFAAARVVVDHDQGSTSLLQRRLRVGYSRAARILDQLERANIVGPPDGTKPRDVLITVDDLETLEASSL